MAQTGKEQNFDAPPAVNDPNIGQYLYNLDLKVVGAAGSPYANDYLQLGATFDKRTGQNRVSFSTSRPGEFPDNFVQDIQQHLPEMLLGIIFGAADDGRVPQDLRNYNYVPVP